MDDRIGREKNSSPTIDNISIDGAVFVGVFRVCALGLLSYQPCVLLLKGIRDVF